MGRYVGWTDVKKHVQDFEAQPDQARMEASIAWAEEYFDGRLRERYTVPFTAASHPNSYALAGRIVQRWAAADYLVNRRQEEADEARATWYADRLVQTGDQLFEQFITGEPPDDAPEVEDLPIDLPQDGYDRLTKTQQSYAEPIFTRRHLKSGDSKHW